MSASTTVRRLLGEMRELSAASSNPNPSFHAQPVSDSDLFHWHFTLAGPPSPSPYAGGLYHGRISLPLTYPLKPPNFRFLTPSGRFEVNREICLSISSFHEESWMPAWGLRTALVALRTFMAEPGAAGQVGGMEATEEVRRQMADGSRLWRCDGCGTAAGGGGMTNEEVMREWWAVCRDKGVKVEAEAGLEELPRGLKLALPDQPAKDEKTASRRKDKDVAAELPATTRNMVGAGTTAMGVNEEAMPVSVDGPPPPPPPTPPPPPSSSSGPSTVFKPDGPSAHPSNRPNETSYSNKPASKQDNSRSATTQPSPTSPSSPRSRTTTTTSTPAIPTTTTTTTATTATVTATTTPILDKAISGLLLALLLMCLKKMLYDPNVMEHDRY